MAQDIVAETSNIFNDEIGTGYYIAGSKVKGPTAQETIAVFYDTEAGQILFDGSNGGFNVEEGKENFPLVGITWNGASDFADYFNLGIPTQEQWTFAATGNEDWLYPWNSDQYEKFANWYFETKLLGYSYTTNLKEVFSKDTNLMNTLEIQSATPSSEIKLIGTVSDVFKRTSRNGNEYVKLTIEDEKGSIDCLFLNSRRRIRGRWENNNRLDRYLEESFQ